LVQGTDQTLFSGGTDSEDRVSLAREEGLHGLADNGAEFITRALVTPYDDDLVFEYVGRDILGEQAEAQLNTQKLMWETPNEVRAEGGRLPPLQGPDAEIGDRLLNPAAIQLAGQEHQQMMAEQQLELQAQQMAAEAAAQGAGPKEAPPSAGGRPHRAPSKSPTKPKAPGAKGKE
jgi:hypothetical protein